MVLAVNAWDEDKDILKQYVGQNKLNQRVLLDGGKTIKQYRVPDEIIPTVLWIDRAGVVVDVDPGSGDVKKLESNTRKLVSGKS